MLGRNEVFKSGGSGEERPGQRAEVTDLTCLQEVKEVSEDTAEGGDPEGTRAEKKDGNGCALQWLEH
jgi:hypothetical protein